MNAPDSDKEHKKIVALLNKMPSHLYRYRSLNDENAKQHVRDLLVDSKLYFTSPLKFNDPLDCKIPPVFDGSQDEIKQYIKALIKRQRPSEPRSLRALEARKMLKEIKSKHGWRNYKDRYQESVNRKGVVSLSQLNNSALMWSYYADAHRGIALRFNMDIENQYQSSETFIPVKVRYKHSMPKNNILKIQEDSFSFISTAFGFKAKAWKHEREWRLINPSGEGLVTISPKMIDGVILGMNISTEDELWVRKCIEDRIYSIPIFRVVHNEGSFDLNIQPTEESLLSERPFY